MLGVSLSQLLGQDEVASFLKGVVAGGRFANAYLFHGPAGVGKCTAALAFARAMLCEHIAGAADAAPDLFAAPAPDPGPEVKAARKRSSGASPSAKGRGVAAESAPDAGRDDACGACAACGKSAALGHPDLRFLFPVSGEEKMLDATINETLDAVRNDPLFVFRYEKFASIRLSLTRDLLRELAYKPFESARRVVVVRDADRMREDQYSALLKSIEEPGAATVWILTTARLARLPATIRSRCQRVRFAPLAEPMVREFLERRADVPEREARMLAALSSGSLARALALRDAEPLKRRDQALALLEPALRGDSAALWKAAQGVMSFGRTGRETLRLMIEFHELWLRDLLRARYGAAKEDLVHRDREPEIRKLAAAVDAAEIRRRLLVLEEVLRAIEGNVTPEMALFSGMSRVAGERLGEGEWPRAATARWDY
jgi:DNA polymerase-3 subunit delta'